MGGGTAIYSSLHHPERVQKLLLVDAAGMPNPLPFLGKLTNLPLVGELMYGPSQKEMRGSVILGQDYLQSSQAILVQTQRAMQVCWQENKVWGGATLPSSVVVGKLKMAVISVRRDIMGRKNEFSRKTKRAAIERQGAKCAFCGVTLNTPWSEGEYRGYAHHLRPIRHGGTADLDNCVYLCWGHHLYIGHGMAPFGIDEQGGSSSTWVQVEKDDFEFWNG